MEYLLQSLASSFKTSRNCKIQLYEHDNAPNNGQREQRELPDSIFTQEQLKLIAEI